MERTLASVDARRSAKVRLFLGSAGLAVAGGMVHMALGVAVFSAYLILDGLFLVPTGDRR